MLWANVSGVHWFSKTHKHEKVVKCSLDKCEFSSKTINVLIMHIGVHHLEIVKDKVVKCHQFLWHQLHQLYLIFCAAVRYRFGIYLTMDFKYKMKSATVLRSRICDAHYNYLLLVLAVLQLWSPQPHSRIDTVVLHPGITLIIVHS